MHAQADAGVILVTSKAKFPSRKNLNPPTPPNLLSHWYKRCRHTTGAWYHQCSETCQRSGVAAHWRYETVPGSLKGIRTDRCSGKG